MEKLIIKATYKGGRQDLTKGQQYKIILTHEDNGYWALTVKGYKPQIIYYKQLKEFIEEWTNISNL